MENPLWDVLVGVVHSHPLYLGHKAYTRDVILANQPEISCEALARRLDMPLGEAMVILSELR